MKTDAIERILTFWFGSAVDDAETMKTQSSLWWGGGPELDAEIESRFGALVQEAVAGGLKDWCETPRGTLARTILLDQFTRNIHRGKPEAFSGDPEARRGVLAALDAGTDKHLRAIERVFLYMPLEHAEDLAMQERSVAVFTALVAEQPEALAAGMKQYVPFAEQHRDIIARFGRFPHRNPILGREPTAAETAYLAEGGATFGQSTKG